MAERDYQISALLKSMAENGSVPLHELTMKEARASALAIVELSGPADETIDSAAFEASGPAGPIAIRRYRHGSSEGKSSALIYFHGGGHCIGSIATHERICQALARICELAVFSVEYRLAPEHPFPAAPEDCFAATRWIAANANELGIDAARIAVGGDSAGGNLATVICQMAKQENGPAIAAQVLIYPNTDLTDTVYHSKSIENVDDPLLSKATIDWFYEHYLTDPDEASNPVASPILSADLSGLPPALILTAGFDPLRDEGAAYAVRLISSGIAVGLIHYPALPHAFIQLIGVIDAAQAALREIASFLRTRLG
ncbi:alpha/beta hydrolase [Agrobacterium pusense]|uniref:alpha/beta hydrolase n=1 Tax=Agrobacterium pusense TaxID=648995 RepID=UPI003FD3DB4C